MLTSYPGIKLVLLFQYGGLGNQFFQYHVAKIIAPNALIVCIGYQELFNCIASPSLSSSQRIQCKLVKGIAARLGVRWMQYLARRKSLIGYISELTEKNQLIVNIAPGIVPAMFMQEGFFQDSSISTSIAINNCPLRSNLVQTASGWLQNNVKSHNLNPYFIHIRRGDYVRWPTETHPAVLPCQWYNRQVKNILALDQRAHFIVFSDDLPFARELFGSRSRFTVYQGSLAEEFALMSTCDGGGILSASTLAWWAASYGRHSFPNAKYIAPKYWAGWPKRQWFPSTIKTAWLNYESVV